MTYVADRDAEYWNRLGLAEFLRFAVPLRILELRASEASDEDGEEARDAARRRRLPPSLAANVHRADAMMFGSKDWRGPTLSSDAWAWALAYLAYTPGGLTFLGVHFCADDHPGCPFPPRPKPAPSDPWWAPLDELAELEGWPPPGGVVRLADSSADEDEAVPDVRWVDDVYLPGDGPC